MAKTETKKQLHLARKIEVAPAVIDKDGQETKAAVVAEIQNMSGRAVRYRVLGPSEHSKCELDAAKLAGPSASGNEIRELQLMHWIYAMVYEVSEPTDNPMTLEPSQWKKVGPTDFLIPGTWDTFFTTQDTQLLQQIYVREHELSAVAVNLLAGKTIPVASEA